MQHKQPRLIITFETTAMALKMEKVCHCAEAPGRLIPVPREITAGCGLSWLAKPEEKDYIVQVMQDGAVTAQGIYIL